MPLSDESKNVFLGLIAGRKDIPIKTFRAACQEAGIKVIERENGAYATVRIGSTHAAATDTNGMVNPHGLWKIAHVALTL